MGYQWFLEFSGDLCVEHGFGVRIIWRIRLKDSILDTWTNCVLLKVNHWKKVEYLSVKREEINKIADRILRGILELRFEVSTPRKHPHNTRELSASIDNRQRFWDIFMGTKNINPSSRRYQESSKGRTTQAETHEKD